PGLQKPGSGEALLVGESAGRRRAALMARVGVVPEEPDAPSERSVSDLETYLRALYPSWDGVGLIRRLSRFDVPREQPFGRLSKGQKSLALVALALAPSPEVLVL